MTVEGPITEVVLLQVKPGVHLSNAGRGSTQSAEEQTLFQLLELIEQQPGFISQHWGHIVEAPLILAWYMHWETPHSLSTFLASPAHDSVLDVLGQVFDLHAAPPLIARFEWDSFASATRAFRSAVTEVAFVSLPRGSAGAAAAAREQITAVSGYEAVQNVGRATGATNGWVYEMNRTSDILATPEGNELAFQGVFGYDSIETHLRWATTPEWALEVEGVEKLVNETHMHFDPVHGHEMFHVYFREGLSR